MSQNSAMEIYFIFLRYSSMVYKWNKTTWHFSWYLENMNNKHISCNEKENVLKCTKTVRNAHLAVFK